MDEWGRSVAMGGGVVHGFPGLQLQAEPLAVLLVEHDHGAFADENLILAS